LPLTGKRLERAGRQVGGGAAEPPRRR